MKKLVILLLLTGAAISYAQIPSPQIPLTGNLGSGGVFPLLNSGTLVFSSDADHTMVYPEMSASFIKVTSSVSLTATRNLIAPLAAGFSFTIQNATTGGQAIQVIGSSGTGVTITNGSTSTVVCDGTNYVLASGSAPTGTPYRIGSYNGSGALGQSNATTDATGNPLTVPGAITGQSANGLANTDFYASGGGNNGITNFLTGCGSNCTSATPPTSTDTENLGSLATINTTFSNPFALLDQRQGQQIYLTKNTPVNTNSPCYQQPSQLFASAQAHCFADVRSGNLDYPQDIGVSEYVVGYGYDIGGTNPAQIPYAGGWSEASAVAASTYSNTRGIMQAFSGELQHHGIGDTDGIAVYTSGDGGWNAPADEGQKAAVFHSDENPTYFHGTVVSGGSGATTLTTSVTSGYQNAFTDGSYLLDITSGATNATYASTGSELGYSTIVYSGTPLPVSTAWGTMTTGSDSAANGKYQIPVTQTKTVALSTSPSSPGDFVTGGNICLIEPISAGIGYPFVEQSKITNATAPSGGQQALTFTTRYAWVTGTLIMQGGVCGLFATNQANSSWRSAVMAIGSFSSSEALISAPTPFSPVDFNLMDSVGIDKASAVTSFYPGAEITGTNNGAANTVTLGTNTAAWNNGDTIEDPHPASNATTGLSIEYSQITPRNASNGGFGLGIGDGDTKPCLLTNCVEINVGSQVEKEALLQYVDASSGGTAGFVEPFQIPAASGGGNFATLHETSGPYTGHWIYRSTENNGIYSIPMSSGGGFSVVNFGVGDAPFRASNTPKNNSTAAGQIAITSLISGSLYEPYFQTISGDASVNAVGVWTNTGVNGAAVPVSASVVGTNSSGQIVAVSSIANVQIALPTGTLTANTCSSVITTTMTGVTTTSTFTTAFATDASGVTGYGSSGGLSIVMWPTANTNNLKVCNPTASSITPGAITINVGAR